MAGSAGAGGGLWFSCLFVLFYFLVAAGGVTHLDLLLENPVNLPFLDVELPLKVFFWLGPTLFLIVHAYVLLHIAMLVDKVENFNTILKEKISGDVHKKLRAKLRAQLPSNVFVQFLAGPSDMRTGVMGFLLKSIMWVSLVIGPIFLLVIFQLQFLPYHKSWITWLQRVMVLLDLALLWILWPSFIYVKSPRAAWREMIRRPIMLTGAGLVTASIFPLITVVVTFPGEEYLGKLRSNPFIQVSRKWLVEGGSDSDGGLVSPFSDHLIWPELDVFDETKYDSEEKIAAIPDGASSKKLRDRDLRGAVLTGADLRKADLTGTNLQDVSLEGAHLHGVIWERSAQLQGASLDGAVLQGASLIEAQLQGASLVGAQLQGASLDSAHLQGAVLAYAHLEGASIYSSYLQGAQLENANLQGASLYRAQLQGVSLLSANLEGASLTLAQLQGAELLGASFKHSYMKATGLWRAKVEKDQLISAQILVPNVLIENIFCVNQSTKFYKGSLVSGLDCQTNDTTELAFKNWKESLLSELPVSKRTDEASKRLDKLNPANEIQGEGAMVERWMEISRNPLSGDDYERKLVPVWVRIGCDADIQGTPYILEGLINQMKTKLIFWPIEGDATPYEELSPFSLPMMLSITPFAKGSKRVMELARQLLDKIDKQTCPGAKGISQNAVDKLKEWAYPPNPAPTPTSAPDAPPNPE